MRVLVFLLCIASPLQALELVYRDSYDLNRPASLEFDPDFCGLWIANEGPEIVLVTLDGLELRRLTSALPRIKSMALQGTRLLVADGYGNSQWLSRDGVAEGAPFRLVPRLYDTEGLSLLPDGTILMVEDEPGHLLWVTPEGAITRRINSFDTTPPMTEPQGIARDPRNGHILVVDDWEGTNSLFEFSAEGELLATFPLLPFGRDPEGIALRASTNTLFIAFDEGAKIIEFDYTPSPGGETDTDTPSSDCVLM